MDAVVLFSHGSLLCGSGEALLEHAERLRSRGVAPIVEVGYLNYTSPHFSETVSKLVSEGAARILVAPYFLVPGKFVRVDLPAAVKAAQEQYPHVEFVIAEAIGYDERLADAIIESAGAAVDSTHWRVDLQRASRYCLAREECPLYATPSCPTVPERSICPPEVLAQ